MNTTLIASLVATGAVTTLSGMKGIETENVYKGVLFLLTGATVGLFVAGFGVQGSGIENPMTVIYAVMATAFGSGLAVLFIQSESHAESDNV